MSRKRDEAPRGSDHMSITRYEIISTLQEHLERSPKVLALWLEGADATNSVDEYSDIDCCCSVEKGALLDVTSWAQRALEHLGALDLAEVVDAGDDHRHTVFHLMGSSNYLLVDFDVFVGRGTDFLEGDEIEKPLILFDRAGVIRYMSPQENQGKEQNRQRMRELKNTIAQSSRIEKYVKRGLFLEAYGYYHRWLLTPLIEILRMRYTPLHPDYYIVHISRHLPNDILQRLEGLFRVNSVADIDAKFKDGLLFFNEIVAELNKSSQ